MLALFVGSCDAFMLSGGAALARPTPALAHAQPTMLFGGGGKEGEGIFMDKLKVSFP